VVFRFGRFELDEEAGELRRDGESVAIQPKPFALLALLLRERERVVSADELFDALWPGVVVTPSSLTRAVSHARRAIGDTHQGDLIRSLPRRGYRFAGEAQTIARRGEAAEGDARAGRVRAEAPALALVPPPAEPADDELFIGRADVLAQLRDVFARARTGSGALALVTGPPGIGKTRVVETFAREAERDGAFVAVAHCREGEGVPAYWPFLQLLRRLLAEPGLRDCVADLATRSQEAAGLLPELEHGAEPRAAGREPAAIAPEQSRFMLFDAAARALGAASRRRPLVLLVEDLQWAGAPSLRLLEHLLFELGSSRLLMLTTVRDAVRPRGHPVDRTLALLRPHARCLHLPLEGFTRADVGLLLERTLGRPAPADLTSELYARTEGVPLFVRETIRQLERRGDLRHPERAARRGILIPDVALDLIRRALDALGPEAARIVGAAAVLGRQFGVARLAELAGVSRADALDRLDEATQSGVVEAAPGGPAVWRFRHALFQEAAYQGLTPGERARLHHRAAELLERRHAADPDAVIAELAHHHHRGLAVGDPERAHAVAVRAAERAAAVLAFEQAADHHEQAMAALEQAETVDPVRRLEALLALGEALRLSGDRTRRREVFAEAIARARTLGRPELLARAAIGRCDMSEWAARDDEARAAVEEALDGLPASAVRERVRLETRLAYLDIRTSPAEGARIVRGAIALARKERDFDALQEALYTLHFALAGPDALDERSAITAELVEHAARGAAREPALIAAVDVACDRITMGDAAGAREWSARARSVAGSDPHPGMAWHLRVYETGLALLEGRFAEAREAAAQALELGRRVEHPYAAGCHRMHAAECAFESEPAMTERWIQPIVGRDVGPMHYFRAWLARTRLALGREAEARAAFDALAADGFADVPRNIRWTRSMIEIAQLCADLRDAERARLLLPPLTAIEHHHAVLPVPICYGGPVRYTLARLLEVDGRSDDALARYDEAFADAAAVGARPVQARILLGWGGLLQRRGAKRDGAKRLGEARALGEELGMAGLVAAAEARLAAS